MANAPRRSRWFSRLSSRAHRPHSSHEPSAQSSGGPHEAHEPAEGGVRPALDPAQREAGLLLRPRFDEAEAGDVGELSSIKLAAARRCQARRLSLRRKSTAIAAVRMGRRRAA